MKITYPQIQRIHGLLPIEIKADKIAKGDLVQQFSNDEKRRSTATLSFIEANQLIESLGGVFMPQNNSEWLKFDWANAQHKKILSLCRQNGWEKMYKGRLIADLGSLATWLEGEKSPVKKAMTKMTPTELSKIIVALENMAQHKWQKKCTTNE